MTESTPIRLVVVDDDEPGRRMLRRVLERRSGYEVHEAVDGPSGLELIRRVAPAAIMLDLRMPGGLSGFDVARALRDDPETREIPVLIVSASVHNDARELADEVGAFGFVEKPVDFGELYSMLDNALASVTDVR